MDTRPARKLSDVVSIQRSPEELCRVWQDPSELASVLFHLLGRFHGESDRLERAANDSAPVADVDIIAVEPARSVSWQARVDGEVRCRGYAEFTLAPPGRGSEVRVAVELEGEGARLLERALEKFQGSDPVLLLREDLRNFKQLMETGEYATTRGQPEGRRSFLGRHLVHAIQDKLQRELSADSGDGSPTRALEKRA